MGSITLGLLLHFYQPPGQLPEILARVVEESYRPLIRVFRSCENARASVNINGVLTEMLHDHGYQDVIEGLTDLAAIGRVEFTSSAKYHVILPLATPAEAERQIALNDETNTRLFGPAYRPRGFFPPEMAWDPALAPIVAAAGLDWVILSGIADPEEWALAQVYRERADGRNLSLLFRDDILSNKIAFRTTDARAFLGDLAALGSPAEDRYVVLAMDAETFGHHIRGWEREFLKALYDLLAAQEEPAGSRSARARPPTHHGLIVPAMLSDLVDRFPAGPVVVPRASSWSTTREDLDVNVPFPLWRHRSNELHRLLWRHLDQAMALYRTAERYAGEYGGSDLATARAFADIAQHSDQFWWASRRPHWSPNMVHRGLNMQRELILNAVRAINQSDAPEEVRRETQDRVAVARDVADRITDRLFWD